MHRYALHARCGIGQLFSNLPHRDLSNFQTAFVKRGLEMNNFSCARQASASKHANL